ncbi:bifunctional GTP diphosphokinase/guanosine-3',5'-bis pyrophosphate 3'-pyrophosphohydrolase [Aggregatibacter actinomycetemcomitans]|uniref:bifunctional GTP diphosphokinase/guanosine-3',5'-bis pyrophosphate 3'-pyrophosphohydrolase n=1 Tax=Aggregatibacter actinomycetemcomitans TaxID=714 RepID=UPI00022BFCD6|nr:bifunctional GTP diphosphokinase/guanosine-3',5'-bis pyrophosphate 3'-pyrophosphohydrolase [Aggregatibacter actinomycetemcomitans]AEW77728.1 GTP pyrophosphokinase [Aggregatibacter actinomycetemcomitans ANH9381]AMQ91830.1 guanosine-3',5'-bis(diphosphate) 3'-pyrophosphohydrolase [Aggregatibacter actinomycetemcomitans]KOE55656.1 guanosine-3',5'-bis(diphosphate) 3'-pyrophosphohydrolase [Aggregatibacter actinomycetemcomitans serotype b str. I23C]KOE57189.1 guanosine-3',5'-bis(diphosphate) 3'-pyro
MYLFEGLHHIIQAYLPPEQIELVKRAFVIARDAHEGQSRSSGEPYITHPVAVASIIAEMRLDHEAVMAALLHDVIEDTPYTEEQLKAEFGASVAEIVEGVSKLDKLKFRTRQEAEVANFRKMILAMTRDIRVVLIKLADRTHNMRTLSALRPDKRRRIAKETLEIYAPLAHRLGIEHIKNELENLGFEAMYPQRYAVLQKVVQIARGNRKDMIERISDEIKGRLQDVGIQARVFGREKHLYAIYQKMRLKDQQFHSIMDIYAFRTVVNNVDTCYRVLGQMHSLYKPRPGRVKDYIAVPKANGYQSLHTSMIGPHGVPVEVQIRTEEMDQMAEMGVAAHWAYKQGGRNDSTPAQIKAQRWLQSLIELQQSAGNSFEFIESVKSEFFPKEIYVFTPKGRIVELPKGATPVDFAYAVHTDVGRNCVAANVDRKPYPLSQALESGQTIDILTSPNAKPNVAWLNFVVTAKARSSIRHALKDLRRDEAIESGKRQLAHALSPLKLEELNIEYTQNVLADLKLASLNDLFMEIGLGNQMSTVIAHRLLGESIEIDTDGNPDNHTGPLEISGNGGLLTTFAQCCHPVPGDPIIAYASPGKGLVIHHESCSNLKDREDNTKNYMSVDWEKSDTQIEFEAELRIEMINQQGTLPHLMSTISAMDSNIQSIWTEEQEGRLYQIIVLLTVKDKKHLAHIIRKIKSMPELISIERNINQ